jgi:hypothetical protein
MERWNHGVRLFGVSILAQKRLLAVNAAIFPPSAPFLSALVPEPILQYSNTPSLHFSSFGCEFNLFNS